MTETFYVRFWEAERYDINRDADVIMLAATTPTGTWWAESERESPAKDREKREAFKTYVAGALQAGLDPCEVEIG